MDELQRGDQIPHFELTTMAGGYFSYRSIWQQKNLVLVLLPHSTGDAGYAAELRAQASTFDSVGAVCVISAETVRGLSAPGVLVADRWGEVVYAAAALRTEDLPAVAELIEWVEYIGRRCSG